MISCSDVFGLIQRITAPLKLKLSDMDVKSRIIELLRSTKRNGIENVISLLDNSDYFTVGCHSHHKYSGGMAQHALQTLEFAKRRGWNIPDDSLIITALLHDICDINRFRHVKGHGWRSVKLLTKYCGLALTQDEWNTIRYHMRSEDDRPVRTSLELAVFRADKKSAKKGYGLAA